MATRKTIVEATSQIIGEKEINLTLPDDRGPLDLTRRIDELEAEVSALKKKQEELDNRPSKWYNYTMKNIMIAFLVLCFTATVGNTNENKIEKYINNEITKTKEFQKVKWQQGKDQLTRTFTQIKSLFVKN